MKILTNILSNILQINTYKYSHNDFDMWGLIMLLSDLKTSAVRYSLTALCAVCAMQTSALAQSETGSANVTLLEEIQFAVLLEMDFGRIATNNAGGVVELSPSTGTRDCGAGLTCVGGFSFSRLSLSGSDALVRVTFQPEFELTGPGDPMRVEPSFPGGSGAVVPLTDGSATFDFGAKLFINPGQASGQYSGTFIVNVNYE